MSGRAVEAAGDVDVLLLDKTGTITLGNRQAAEFIPVDGASEREVADAAQLASLTDETPEGRSIVVLAKERFDIRARVLEGSGMATIPFTAQTRMSGVDFDGHEIRKGAADAVKDYVESHGGTYSVQCTLAVEDVSRAGGTPLLVARDHRILGVVHLKDIVKQGIKENFADLRTMGIKTVMITGDNPMTAAAIAAEAAVMCPEGNENPSSGAAPAKRHQSRKSADDSNGRGRATRSLSTMFVASAPRQTATNMTAPARRVRLNAMSTIASAKKHAPFSPAKLTASNSGVNANPPHSASAWSAPKIVESNAANATFNHSAIRVVSIVLSFRLTDAASPLRTRASMKRSAPSGGKPRCVARATRCVAKQATRGYERRMR